MDIGKVPLEILKKHVFSNFRTDKNFLLLPNIGEDCAAVDIEGEIAVLTTDPITAGDSMSGFLSVIVACNDLAAAGAQPLGVLTTVLLPPGSDEDDFAYILTQIRDACNKLNIHLLGGHSEVTTAVTRPLIVSTGFGKVKKELLISTGGAKPGDKIVITKTIGLEGTFILYNKYKEKLKDILNSHEEKEIESFVEKLSVVKEGMIAREYASSMHDITEGGLFGAIYEVCRASGKGAVIYEDMINLSAAVQKVCAFFNLNPYKLISSGSMLITTNMADELVKKLLQNGIECCIVGEIIEKPNIEFISKSGEKTYINELPIDEIYKVV
ncbi:hydrogenase maturation factor [Caldicellulosiruptor bescii]|uniref:AIR synthase related protein domain protein n=2 Tax=Caldicellulosiruptor bescii TaxID=31899 RepID=B9MSA1_CALBD|nr:AIR synthase family protein [Caldicellulosiruptor bescii]ACM60555.1 AIR synthase related protein domain protein [Caldicellulosiruptor bescii DSM 6725]PBC87966.1 hydrogenase maturation factor [Caldicellulosiruptor bescii]PBC90898.1 hydrogenase maturation factor [Caldicellulosiruptor bescii]PBD03670.1 hydrogenase maturation factor [Caldicellulosiruptor bescii]PBD06696.1 hydrogenase maturation factor [Caldicellulosiruptor bescii]